MGGPGDNTDGFLGQAQAAGAFVWSIQKVPSAWTSF